MSKLSIFLGAVLLTSVSGHAIPTPYDEVLNEAKFPFANGHFDFDDLNTMYPRIVTSEHDYNPDGDISVTIDCENLNSGITSEVLSRLSQGRKSLVIQFCRQGNDVVVKQQFDRSSIQIFAERTKQPTSKQQYPLASPNISMIPEQPITEQTTEQQLTEETPVEQSPGQVVVQKPHGCRTVSTVEPNESMVPTPDSTTTTSTNESSTAITTESPTTSTSTTTNEAPTATTTTSTTESPTTSTTADKPSEVEATMPKSSAGLVVRTRVPLKPLSNIRPPTQKAIDAFPALLEKEKGISVSEINETISKFATALLEEIPSKIKYDALELNISVAEYELKEVWYTINDVIQNVTEVSTDATTGDFNEQCAEPSNNLIATTTNLTSMISHCYQLRLEEKLKPIVSLFNEAQGVLQHIIKLRTDVEQRGIDMDLTRSNMNQAITYIKSAKSTAHINLTKAVQTLRRGAKSVSAKTIVRNCNKENKFEDFKMGLSKIVVNAQECMKQ